MDPHTEPLYPPDHPDPDRPGLLAGTIATSLVAGQIAVLGVVAAHTLLGADIIGPHGDRTYAATTVYEVTAIAIGGALCSGLLLHVLSYITPRPLLFFGWITWLATALLALWPFSTAAGALSKIATAAVYLAIGVAIATLMRMVARDTVAPG